MYHLLVIKYDKQFKRQNILKEVILNECCCIVKYIF